MKRTAWLLLVFGLVLSVLCWRAAYSQSEGSADRTGSPYFFVPGAEAGLDELPLKSTSAAVRIAGVIADMTVHQVYRNEGERPLEAIYVFPASTRAAVYGMKMTIGTRVIEAKIEKRAEARRRYEEARNEGRSASLLEEERPNVFRMNVANIMPRDEITVELKYTELLIPEDGVYEFMYPTVVGPRYVSGQTDRSSGGGDWTRNPYFRAGKSPSSTFAIRTSIAAGAPIREIACPSHKTTVTYRGTETAEVALAAEETAGGNRDFILRYRLDGDTIGTGLLLSQGAKENFFLLTVRPPRRVAPQDIPGREYVFIVDVSGSMHGFPLDTAKKLLADLIGGLRPTDCFNVLLFSGGSAVLAETSLPATPENRDAALRFLTRQQGGGGTEILPALKRALSLPKPENFSRTFVIATDGYVAVEEEVFDLIHRNLGRANMFAFGIGTSVNRFLIEGMARAGMGEPFVITKPAEAPAQAERFRRMIASPVLTDVRAVFDGFAAYNIEPASIPDVLADRPVIIFGKWRGTPRGTVTVSGMAGNGAYRKVTDVGRTRPSETNAALRYLWARHRIALLADYNALRTDEKRTAEVTALGLAYNLLTPYTSFVAVDTQVRNREGRPTTVKQPLPIPLGVSDYAVGGALMNSAAPMTMMSRPLAAELADRAQETTAPLRTEKKGEGTIVTLAELIVSPNLSRDAVRRSIEGRLRELTACLSPEAKGKIVIAVKIGTNGTITDLRVLSGTRDPERLRTCLRAAVQGWTLPAGRDGREATARLTLNVSR